jgi:hypothetical protein
MPSIIWLQILPNEISMAIGLKRTPFQLMPLNLVSFPVDFNQHLFLEATHQCVAIGQSVCAHWSRDNSLPENLTCCIYFRYSTASPQSNEPFTVW